MKKILVTGNLGYIGPVVCEHLKKTYKNIKLLGLDTGYFQHIANSDVFVDRFVDFQILKDIRDVDAKDLEGVEGIISLAAISNDPMGKKFEDVTYEINQEANFRLAKIAKEAGVKNFAIASSCSVYGLADGENKTEKSSTGPLTAYAKSKLGVEQLIEPLADDNFTITCLRYGTACGPSPRIRLDLVLNDFVASAVLSKKITILSNGKPWRPIIDVRDMARAMDWAAHRTSDNGGNFLVVNVGRDDWNFQVSEMANEIKNQLPEVDVEINLDAPEDKRSYKVDFGLFKELAPNHQPQLTLSDTINDIASVINTMPFENEDFRQSTWIRLNVLENLRDKQYIDKNVRWLR